ncbi:MAG: VOC family protein [Vicinamibacterales bacterium]
MTAATNVPERHGVAAPGYRLPASTVVGAVRLLVSDLGRSIDFYQRVLGLSVVERSSDAAALAPAGHEPVLIRLETRAGVRGAGRRGALGLFHFAILLPDRASLGRFVAHLAALGVPAGMSDHLVSEALYLSDPDGLGIEVYADRPRDRWTYRAGQLRMSTEPLDVRDLVAAGGGQPWTGMPAGTAMGHLHLHVGDLDAAEAFFHRALGFDKVVWNYPGALFLSAGGYHHHLGTNTWAPPVTPPADQAQLRSWDLVLPDAAAIAAAGDSLERSGYVVDRSGDAVIAPDPWGTTFRLVTTR